MASNHTTNYNLNQWEATDKVLRTDFNEDNAKIDAALKDHDDEIAELEAANTALESALALKGNCQIELKTYTGTGEYGASHPNHLTFSDMPAVLLIFGQRSICMVRGGDIGGVVSATSSIGHVLSGAGFSWSGGTVSYYSNDPYFQLNVSGQVYCAVAFFAQDET